MLKYLNIYLAISIVILNVLDFVTTYLGLNFYGLYEANPNTNLLLLFVKIPFCLGLLFIVIIPEIVTIENDIQKKVNANTKKGLCFTLIVLNIIYGIVIINNFYWIVFTIW